MSVVVAYSIATHKALDIPDFITWQIHTVSAWGPSLLACRWEAHTRMSEAVSLEVVTLKKPHVAHRASVRLHPWIHRAPIIHIDPVLSTCTPCNLGICWNYTLYVKLHPRTCLNSSRWTKSQWCKSFLLSHFIHVNFKCCLKLQPLFLTINKQCSVKISCNSFT